MNNPKQQQWMPKTAILFASLSLISLVLLHFLSPEFDPGWRMVSEYALGEHNTVLAIFFISWGFASMLLAVSLWKEVTKIPAKIGTVFLFISGIGATLASYFDVSQPGGHGFAGLLGIPTVPVAALLISYHLAKKPHWKNSKTTLLLLAHGTWITLILMVVAMIIMINGFQNAGVEMGPGAEVPTNVPDGVIAVVGYANRLLILADMFWLICVSRILLKPKQAHAII